MKQTAVEFILSEIWKFDDENLTIPNRLVEMIEQAKEMEKQQQGYSEKEVLELLYKREDYINSEVNIFDYQTTKEWFEQFKKK